jgi:uncharacterized protein (TIGR02453 family)
MTFTPAALRFLRGLAKNNNKEWFEAHRAEYETEVREPMRDLIGEMNAKLATVAPEIGGDPKRSMFRINRDIRFSKDKSPYKTHAALWVFHRDAGRGVGRDAHGGAGFYFHLEPGGSLVAGGFWMPPRPLLTVIRERIAKDRREQRGFERLVSAKAFADRFGGLTDDEPGAVLTRSPRGYAEDHPAARWLRFNTFTASRALTDAEALSPRLVDAIMKDFAALLPLVRWLNATLGHPPARQR